MSHRTQESTLLTITRLVERTQLRNSQMDEMRRARYGEGVEGTTRPFPGAQTPSTPCVHQPQPLELCHSGVFMEASLPEKVD